MCSASIYLQRGVRKTGNADPVASTGGGSSDTSDGEVEEEEEEEV